MNEEYIYICPHCGEKIELHIYFDVLGLIDPYSVKWEQFIESLNLNNKYKLQMRRAYGYIKRDRYYYGLDDLNNIQDWFIHEIFRKSGGRIRNVHNFGAKTVEVVRNAITRKKGRNQPPPHRNDV